MLVSKQIKTFLKWKFKLLINLPSSEVSRFSIGYSTNKVVDNLIIMMNPILSAKECLNYHWCDLWETPKIDQEYITCSKKKKKVLDAAVDTCFIKRSPLTRKPFTLNLISSTTKIN